MLVYFFKPSGKYYTEEEVGWTKNGNGYIVDEFALSLREHFQKTGSRLNDMTAVCIEPDHSMPYPLMIRDGKWRLEL